MLFRRQLITVNNFQIYIQWVKGTPSAGMDRSSMEVYMRSLLRTSEIHFSIPNNSMYDKEKFQNRFPNSFLFSMTESVRLKKSFTCKMAILSSFFTQSVSTQRTDIRISYIYVAVIQKELLSFKSITKKWLFQYINKVEGPVSIYIVLNNCH